MGTRECGVGREVRKLIDKHPEMTNKVIALIIQHKFPNAKTTANTVGWLRWQYKKRKQRKDNG